LPAHDGLDQYCEYAFPDQKAGYEEDAAENAAEGAVGDAAATGEDAAENAAEGTKDGASEKLRKAFLLYGRKQLRRNNDKLRRKQVTT